MNTAHSCERTLECPSAIQMMLFHSANILPYLSGKLFFLFCLIQKFIFFRPNKLLSLLDNSNKATLHVLWSKITNCIVDHTTIRHMQPTTIVSSDLPTWCPHQPHTTCYWEPQLKNYVLCHHCVLRVCYMHDISKNGTAILSYGNEANWSDQPSQNIHTVDEGVGVFGVK